MTLDDIGEDIEADQDKHSHCDECNQYFVLKEHLDQHENKAQCMAKERPVKGDDDGLEKDGKQVFCLKKAYQSVCHFCMKHIGNLCIKIFIILVINVTNHLLIKVGM